MSLVNRGRKFLLAIEIINVPDDFIGKEFTLAVQRR
jgi:hypothetical protein